MADNSHLKLPKVSLSSSSFEHSSPQSDLDADPSRSGSDESLIDISEEVHLFKTEKSQPYLNETSERQNQKAPRVRGETPPQDLGSGPDLVFLTPSINCGTTSLHSKQHLRVKADCPAFDHLVSTQEQTPQIQPAAKVYHSSPSKSSSKTNNVPVCGTFQAGSHSQDWRIEAFQQQLLHAKLSASRYQSSSAQQGDQYFLGDPTFAVSYVPPTLSYTGDSNRSKNAKNVLETGIRALNRTPTALLGDPMNKPNVDVNHVTEEERHTSFQPFSSALPSGMTSQSLAHEDAIGLREGSPGGKDSDNSDTGIGRSIPFDRGWNSSASEVTAEVKKTSVPDGTTNGQVNSFSISGENTSQNVSTRAVSYRDETLKANVNHTFISSPPPPPSLTRRPQMLQTYTKDVKESGGLPSDLPRATERPTADPPAMSARQAMTFQRNSYGEFSPLPYTSVDIAGTQSQADDRMTEAMGPFRHCHRANVSSSLDKVAKRQLVSVVALCLTFMIGEAIGGVLSNSLALFTDVLHLGSDLISFIISLFALFLSNKGATKGMSFGYHRAEVLGALFSVFLIWLVSGVLCYIAVERIIQEHYKNVKPDQMLITASLGVVFNIIMAVVLHSEWCCKTAHSHSKFGHGHSHGRHSNGHSNLLNGSEYQPLQSAIDFEEEFMERYNEENKSRNGSDLTEEEVLRQGLMKDEAAGVGHHHHKNLNVRAAFIHVIGDIIQSLGVLVAALIIKLKPEEQYRLADPICTFLFSILVLATTVAVLRDTIRVMMEGVPRDLSYEALKRDLLSLDGVVMVHSLHIWALTIGRNAIAVHLAVDDPRIHNQVLSSATYMIQNRHHLHYSTIQVELYDPEVMTSCQKCMELEL